MSTIASSASGYTCTAAQSTLDNSTTTTATSTLSATGCSVEFSPQLVSSPRVDTFSVQISRHADESPESAASSNITAVQNVTIEAYVSVFRARMVLETNTDTLRRISPNACSADASAIAAADAEATAGNFTIPTYQTAALRALAEFSHPDTDGAVLSVDVSCCVPMSASGGSGSGSGGSAAPASVLEIAGGVLTATGPVDNATISIDPASGTELSTRICSLRICTTHRAVFSIGTLSTF